MNKVVSDYYDYTLPFYKFFWHKNTESYALHYGFWERDSNNLQEALLNTNKFLAEKAHITSGDAVLDAGCGVGGSSIWLAKNFKVNVTGISISEKQISEAKRLAAKNSVSKLIGFFVSDYLKTDFKSNSYDVVWAIESVCHANNKKDFLKEAYRLLKKGGRLMIADGFRSREPKNDKETQILHDFTEGFALPNLALSENFKKSMSDVGFSNIKFWNKTKEVLPSSKKLFDMCKFGYPIAKITEKLHLTSPILTKNNLAGVVQYEAVKTGFGIYGVLYGVK